MSNEVEQKRTPAAMLWTGRVLSTLMALFMAFDGIMKLFKPAVVVEATTKLGYSESAIVPIGITALVAAVLYAVPRTSVLGAILLTGFFGGATATQLMAHQSTIAFPIGFGVVMWLGLYLRDARSAP